MKKKLWYFVSYPIRLILRKKVKRYKLELEQHEQLCRDNPIRHRRCGKTNSKFYASMERLVTSYKYSSFIEKWDVK